MKTNKGRHYATTANITNLKGLNLPENIDDVQTIKENHSNVNLIFIYTPCSFIKGVIEEDTS